MDLATGFGAGRAGMGYRDLIPSRLGGRFIASHIRIDEAGPVPDYAHYHHIRFQMIFCRSGWVRVVYEDQGEPFILNAGDCVTQPPQIRHRVLEASDGLQVIEIGVPAEHITAIEHEMDLPNETVDRERRFFHRLGQRRVRVAGARQILCRAPELHQDRGLRDDLADGRSDHVHAQDTVSTGIGQNLYQPAGLAERTRLARGVRPAHEGPVVAHGPCESL